MPTPSIASQVDAFNEGFTAQIGPDLSAVFDQEQTALRDAGIPDNAVTAGDVLPAATLKRTSGDRVQLAEVLGGKPAVVVFYRGSWCPYCNLALKAYRQHLLPVLDDLGVGLVAISPQTPDASEAIVTAAELGFPVLSDPGNILAGALGIVTEPTRGARSAHTQLGFDVADSNADHTGNIPFPTVLIVDREGVVVFADVHVDYTTRTEVDTITEQVRTLTSAR